jgi:hypothetical protein
MARGGSSATMTALICFSDFALIFATTGPQSLQRRYGQSVAGMGTCATQRMNSV